MLVRADVTIDTRYIDYWRLTPDFIREIAERTRDHIWSADKEKYIHKLRIVVLTEREKFIAEYHYERIPNKEDN